jgi:hypothetical protein
VPDVATPIELACSLQEARSLLAETAALGCFPGVTRAAAAGQRARFQHTIELPLLGPRTQAVEVAVEQTHASERTAHVIFAASGALVSVSGCWTLEEGDGRVDARLTAGYQVAEEVVGQAVDELRSRSPLPIRTDADAILRRAVKDFFDAYFAGALAEYRDRVRGLVAGRP